MRSFSQLLDRLVLTPSRNAKLQLLRDYFAATPDPDRGFALAALTGRLDIASVKPAMLRSLMAERMDDVLFRLSYDYVGDLAETIALVWNPQSATKTTADDDVSESTASLSAIVESLQLAGKTDAKAILTGWLDQLDASGRYALLKLLTGGLRIGVSARLAKLALAEFGKVDVTEIEELWHGQEVPFVAFFAWLDGNSPKPRQSAAAPFRPVMLANALTDTDRQRLDASQYAAEWKWDGIRIQATAERGTKRLYSRTGDDVGQAFPDLLAAMEFEGTLDGELLVARTTTDDLLDVGSFGDLQQRLNRKTVSKKLMASHPVFLRAYDLLEDGKENLRNLPFVARRERLERFVPHLERTRFDISPLLEFNGWD